MFMYINNETDITLESRSLCSFGNDVLCDEIQIYCGSVDKAIYAYHYYISNQYICSNVGWKYVYPGTITCDTQESICIIDCTANIQDCSGYLINGWSAMVSLTVICAGKYMGCTGATILCPTHSSATCTVECAEHSCEGLIVTANSVDLLEVHCNGNTACGWMVVNASYSYSLKIYCNGLQSCSSTNIYCPSNRVHTCHIDCNNDSGDMSDKTVCQDMEIRVNNFYTYDYLSLLCNNNGCHSYNHITFICYSSHNRSINGIYIRNETGVKGEYQCVEQSSLYCCPWLGSIICDIDNCSVNCSDQHSRRCTKTVIDATHSTSLNLTCVGIDKCADSNVYCSSTLCNIYCKGSNACNGVGIYANETDVIRINCEYSNACDNMLIYGQNSSFLLFNSTSGQSRVRIYAENAETVQLYCKGDHACSYMDVYADNVSSISVSASQQYGYSNGNFHVSNAGLVEIICASHGNGFACYNNKLYLPMYGNNTSIYCYGIGCNDFG
eukprot:217165_1